MTDDNTSTVNMLVAKYKPNKGESNQSESEKVCFKQQEESACKERREQKLHWDNNINVYKEMTPEQRITYDNDLSKTLTGKTHENCHLNKHKPMKSFRQIRPEHTPRTTAVLAVTPFDKILQVGTKVPNKQAAAVRTAEYGEKIMIQGYETVVTTKTLRSDHEYLRIALIGENSSTFIKWSCRPNKKKQKNKKAKKRRKNVTDSDSSSLDDILAEDIDDIKDEDHTSWNCRGILRKVHHNNSTSTFDSYSNNNNHLLIATPRPKKYSGTKETTYSHNMLACTLQSEMISRPKLQPKDADLHLQKFVQRSLSVSFINSIVSSARSLGKFYL